MLLKQSSLLRILDDNSMKIAIMQPYVFPYIGYFQLIHAVDKFVFYDDVNFIKQGWINRNRILSNDAELLFSVPLEQISSYRKINETKINESLYTKWQNKFLKTIEQSYKRAPYFPVINPMIRTVLSMKYVCINQLCVESVNAVIDYLEINTDIIPTSCGYNNDYLKAQDRVIDICIKENASVYVNAFGGIDLYNRSDFENAGLDLFFLRSRPTAYSQFNENFISSLSIIDVLMFNSPERIQQMLDEYEVM